MFQEKDRSESIFNFIGSDANKTLSIGTLGKGIYFYEALSVSNGKNLSSKGQFIIKDAQLERLHLQLIMTFSKIYLTIQGDDFIKKMSLIH